MTLLELIAQFRTDTGDKKKPYLFAEEDVILWLNEAVEEAALRADLIFEATDPALTRIPIAIGKRVYPLNPAIFRITHATFTPADSEDEPRRLEIHSRLVLDDAHRARRTTTDTPRAMIVDDTRFELDCLPEAAGTLTLECYRAPCNPMKVGKDCPEIGRAHHRFLTKWAEHRAFSRPDSETLDQGRAERAEAEFTRQFGMRPDAERRRGFEGDAPAHNAGYY